MADKNAIESEEAELREMDAEAQRSKHETDVEMALFEGMRAFSEDPVDPVRLDGEDTFCFSCHREVGCWNKCCHGADITLTPYDIVRLSRGLGMAPQEFLLQYSVPAVHDQSGLPVAKLRMTGEDGSGPCNFMTDAGCSVYENRPATCRYYPLGLLNMKLKGGEDKDAFHFIVREKHCEGHAESKEQTVGGFRDEQGVDTFDRANQGWIDILMKMSSWRGLGGPHGKDVSKQTKQMFFMVSTDVDKFRRFVLESRFLQTYAIDDDMVDVIKVDDVALLRLGFDWMKNVMFNEPTIGLREEVMHEAIAKARRDYAGGG